MRADTNHLDTPARAQHPLWRHPNKLKCANCTDTALSPWTLASGQVCLLLRSGERKKEREKLPPGSDNGPPDTLLPSLRVWPANGMPGMVSNSHPGQAAVLYSKQNKTLKIPRQRCVLWSFLSWRVLHMCWWSLGMPHVFPF